MIPAIHLTPRAKLTETNSRAFPLLITATARTPLEIAAFLDVEKSPRYKPTAAHTFCNIYAHDFCYLAGVYLPRVWWTQAALKDLGKGTKVLANYGKTVYELDANALYAWLTTHGADFGWRAAASLNEMQAAANSGDACLISAQRRDLAKPGHISCVLPESSEILATWKNGVCTQPLQSQAGTRNYRCSVKPGRWWEKPDFAASGFFINSEKPAAIPLAA